MFQLQLSSLNCKRSPACTAYASTATTTMDSGYPLDWFSESVDTQLICEICGKVLQSPRATPCGHHFCLHCLEFWIEYYGICPKRCGEIELESLRKDPQIEKRILALAVYCKYQNTGCNAQIPLAEKQKHEKKCIHKGKAELPNILVENKNSLSQDTYVEMASVECRNKTVEHAPPKTNLHPAPELAYYTYHLTRKAPGESLGFILVAGAKNSNGKAVNFSIKTVNPGTVAAEAGLLPGDKILQVDHIGLSQLTQQEAVSRIKDNPRVILTVLRAHSKRPTVNDHIYEDILYSDIPNQENTTHHNTASGGDMASRERTESTGRRDQSHLHRKKSDPFPTRIMISTEGLRHKSPTFTTVNSDPPRGFAKSPKLLTEKISADSGLSSSTSSFSPSHNSRERTRYLTDGPATELDRHHSHHIEKPKRYSHETRRGKTSAGGPSPLSHNRKIRIEGDYEVEEIFLQKNGTNQLGITLGYDTKSSSGNLFVCEIISDGLAAKDGRIKRGDIVRKVNGFDVYDPEEAVLLFLEQDQDISLTVARKIKSHHRHRKGMLASKSQCALNSPLLAQDVFDFEGSLRRTDSCGSLDSHNYKYTEEEKTTRRNSESVATKHSTSHPSTSSYSTGLVTPSISTDYIFRPIKEGRPATAGEFHTESRLLRSSTSLGSAPEPTRHPSPQIHQTTTARHQSFDANHSRMLRSLSPIKYPSQNFKMSCHDVLPNRGDMIAPAERLAMYRSVSTFRCESLV